MVQHKVKRKEVRTNLFEKVKVIYYDELSGEIRYWEQAFTTWNALCKYLNELEKETKFRKWKVTKIEKTNSDGLPFL